MGDEKLVELKNRVTGMVYLVLILLSLSLLGCSNQVNANKADADIEIMSVKAGQLTGQLKLSGVLTAQKSANITSEIPGVINNVFVKEGQLVNQGQRLVGLDDTDLQIMYNTALLQLEQSKETVNLAKLKYENTKKEFDRVEALYGIGAETQEDYEKKLLELESLRTSYQTALLGLELAKANLSALELQLAKSTVVSPFGGIIASLEIEQGEMASPGKPILSLVKLDTVLFSSSVQETNIKYFNLGQKVQGTFEAVPGKTYTGEVSFVSPVSTAAGQRYPVEFSFNNEGNSLKAGMTGNVKVDVSSMEDSVLISKGAIFTRSGVTYCFKVVDNKVKKQKISLGINDGKNFVVLEGLKAGDQIASGQIDYLYDGKIIE